MRFTIKPTTTIATLLALLLLFSGCSQEDAEQTEGGLDLIAMHGVARQLIETGRIDISSPSGHYYTERGWSRRFRDEQSGLMTMAAVTRSSILRYHVLRPAERWLEFNASLQGPHHMPQLRSSNIAMNSVRSFSLRSGPPSTLPQTEVIK